MLGVILRIWDINSYEIYFLFLRVYNLLKERNKLMSNK